MAGELLDSNTAYLNRAVGLDDARTQLTHLLGMQRRAVELPAELAAAERAFADEESEETLGAVDRGRPAQSRPRHGRSRDSRLTAGRGKAPRPTACCYAARRARA